jgi:hypothetical protein
VISGAAGSQPAAHHRVITDPSQPAMGELVGSQMYWSAALTVMFLASLVLIGKHNPWGWALGIADELLWAAYAVATRQWPFIISAVAYTAVCLRNLRAWRRETAGTGDRP